MSLPRFLVSALLGAAVGAAPVAFPMLARQSAPVADQDLLLGTWQLNLEKSRYSPGPAPTSETRTYARDGSGIEGTIRRSFPDGRSERIEYRADYDREYPVSGTAEYDHLILKRINEYTAEAVLSHAGKIFGTARRVIARDGKTMTITFQRDQGSGEKVYNVAVYDKEEK
jgi:hypothetical protein